jgi:hypothetical protein
MSAPQPNDGDLLLSDEQEPPMTLLLVRGANRLLLAPLQVQPLKVNWLYWLKAPGVRSLKSKPGFCLSVHWLLVLLGHWKGLALWKPYKRSVSPVTQLHGEVAGSTYSSCHTGSQGKNGNGVLHVEDTGNDRLSTAVVRSSSVSKTEC